MSIMSMIIGQSGTGKSTSLRNFKPGEVAVINVSGKPFPFRSALPSYKTDDYSKAEAAIKTAVDKGIRTVVIDDCTYLMVNEFMRTVKVTGYQKFSDMAQNFFNLVEYCAKLPEDVTVYFLGHTEQADDGREHFKTIGKLLDDKVVMEGKFTIVLKTLVKDGKYLFATQNNGQDTVKSPMGMFPAAEIDNDLKDVDAVIRAYYGITEENK